MTVGFAWIKPLHYGVRLCRSAVGNLKDRVARRFHSLTSNCRFGGVQRLPILAENPHKIAVRVAINQNEPIGSSGQNLSWNFNRPVKRNFRQLVVLTRFCSGYEGYK